MITGVTTTEYDYKELKIFLASCDKDKFKDFINDDKYKELINYVRYKVNDESLNLNYRDFFTELLHLLTTIDLDKANKFSSYVIKASIRTVPLFACLKIDKINLEEEKLVAFRGCDIEELTVEYSHALGFNVLMDKCNITTLKICNSDVDKDDIEETFSTCNIGKIELI